MLLMKLLSSRAASDECVVEALNVAAASTAGGGIICSGATAAEAWELMIDEDDEEDGDGMTVSAAPRLTNVALFLR